MISLFAKGSLYLDKHNRRMKITCLKFVVMMLITSTISWRAYAQKLPGTQKESLRAPANIKIDGKATEWKDGMQAYSRAIQAQYTVANDDKRLYLIVRADKREIINKIINGGVSFSINKNNKKSNDDVVTVTYPVFARGNRPSIGFNHLSEALDNEKDQKKRDSVMLGCNNSLEAKAKYIRVNNLPEVDTLISVYNFDGVKAKSAFDYKLVYTVEIGIDLKTLNIKPMNLDKFTYNVKLNGVALDYVPGIEITRDAAGNYAGMSIIKEIANAYLEVSKYDTDFWGEYKLVK
jgi:hypothetical protein